MKILTYTNIGITISRWSIIRSANTRVEALYVPQILGFEQVVGTDELVSAILRHVRFIACVPLPHVFEQSVAATYGPNWQTRKNEKKKLNLLIRRTKLTFTSGLLADLCLNTIARTTTAWRVRIQI